MFSSLHENADCRCFHFLNGRNTSRALSKSPPHKWKPSFEEEENRVSRESIHSKDGAGSLWLLEGNPANLVLKASDLDPAVLILLGVKLF